MPITAYAKWNGQSGSDGARPTDEDQYLVFGTDDAGAARAYLRDNIADVVNGNILDTIDVQQIGEEIWEATARYLNPESKGEKEEKVKEIGDEQFAFRTGGGTITRYATLETMGTYTPGSITPYDSEGLIHNDGDGSPRGVEVFAPKLEFTIEAKLPLALITPEFVKTMANMTGTVNNAPFKGFAAGEVLFLGLDGKKDGRDSCTLTYAFACSENVPDLEIPEAGVTGIVKGGWHYLWIAYRQGIDPASKKPRKEVHSVLVERVYESSNFASLGIST